MLVREAADSRGVPDRGRRPAGGHGSALLQRCKECIAVSTSFLDRERTVAPPGYSRFLIPPAALAVHLSIGSAYAFSTFNLPLTRLIGIEDSAPGDWKLSQVG